MLTGQLSRTLLSFDPLVGSLWQTEKAAAAESLIDAKEEGLAYLELERTRIMRMNHAEALRELIKTNKLEERKKVISDLQDNGLMELV